MYIVSCRELQVVPLDTKVPVSLEEIGRDKDKIVMDLWKSECPNCPGALARLAQQAREDPDTLYMAANIDSMEYAEMMAEDGQLDSLVHVYMESDVKEYLKRMLNFRKVPYSITFHRNDENHGMFFITDCGMATR